jgi:hypothetical protein
MDNATAGIETCPTTVDGLVGRLSIAAAAIGRYRNLPYDLQMDL